MNTHVHGVVTIAGRAATRTNVRCGSMSRIPQAIDGSVFGTELDPLDLSGMEREAAKQLCDVFTLNLYVTGLTVALIAVLNVCREQKIKVTLYHYNRETGNYYPQEVK